MNLKSFRALQTENAQTAMIVDLTERYPRGPAGKLRKKDYTQEHYYEEASSPDLIGGDKGYDLFEIYALCDKNMWENDLLRLTTRVEGAAMGRALYGGYDDNGVSTLSGEHQIFKPGAMCTRRLRRLKSRLAAVKKMVEAKSTKNVYNLHVGNARHPIACFGRDGAHAKQTFDLLLSAVFEAACPSGLIAKSRYGYGNADTLEVHSQYHGPAHGPHEIMAVNNEFSEAMRDKKEKLKQQIEVMKQQIADAEALATMVDSFTLSTCAAYTEEL